MRLKFRNNTDCKNWVKKKKKTLQVKLNDGKILHYNDLKLHVRLRGADSHRMNADAGNHTHGCVSKSNIVLFRFFFSSIQQESINNKMCINKYEDRIVHYCVATVSKYIIWWVHLQVKSSQSVHVRPAGKRDLGCSPKAERVVWRKWCFGSVATIQSSLESETRLMLSGDCYIHF